MVYGVGKNGEFIFCGILFFGVNVCILSSMELLSGGE